MLYVLISYTLGKNDMGGICVANSTDGIGNVSLVYVSYLK